MASISILNLTKKPLPLRRAFLQRAKDEILGKKYDLSLVFAGYALTRRLNRERRGKDRPANTLSFFLSKSSGEIFLNPKEARRKATGSVPLKHLFIHSLLHLKGYSHGSTMKSEEDKYLLFYADTESYRNGN